MRVSSDVPLYRTVHWGMGAGLLVCQECGALVFPEPDDDVDRHADWHARIDGEENG